MTPIASFSATAATWQNFYILVGAGSTTLMGLMFVAVTFGSGIVTPKTAATARSFLDPTLNHFVQVLLTACLVAIPTMGPTLLGALIFAIGATRIALLVKIYRHISEASRAHNDIELSDWLSGIIVPLLTYTLLIATGAGFVAGYQAAFNALAIATLAALLNGVFSAWELMVWMAVTRSQRKSDESSR